MTTIEEAQWVCPLATWAISPLAMLFGEMVPGSNSGKREFNLPGSLPSLTSQTLPQEH